MKKASPSAGQLLPQTRPSISEGQELVDKRLRFLAPWWDHSRWFACFPGVPMRMHPVAYSSKSLTDTNFLALLSSLSPSSPPHSASWDHILVNLKIQSHFEVLGVSIVCERGPQESPDSKLNREGL